MYSFAQRSDTMVVDEPLYAHYLTSTHAKEYHPGAEEVIADQENDGRKVIEEIIFGEYQTSIVFFKHMTHHLVDLDWSFMKHTVNVILTRDPKEMLTSFINQIPNPNLHDTGYPQHLELMKFLKGMGQHPIVIDSKDVLLDPRKNSLRFVHISIFRLKKICCVGKPEHDPKMGYGRSIGIIMYTNLQDLNLSTERYSNFKRYGRVISRM